ncbi:hypothetical protein COV20_05430 [Candidatus Woesearchaeota archaeon CG10_big_fil_rev_8_21_14_0_10_45_16]|nr:MAG: hypothetical protein COV20_05430 [Candidatus Woesearchaeota archaeon CG10_big_fil_rev_8_21_14_0_10_45_16]
MAFTQNQKKWIFVVLFVILLALATFVIRSYLGAIVIGALITYFIYPVYLKLKRWVRYPLLAQIILAIGSIILLALLLTVIIVPLASQTQTLYKASEPFLLKLSDESSACVQPGSLQCRAFQQLQQLVSGTDFRQKSKEILQKASSFFFESVSGLISSAVSLLIFFAILVYSIFYFLGNGEEIKKNIFELIPLQERHKNQIFQRLKDTINAVIGGNISTALLQGLTGGLIFFILGIPSPFFWGLMMAILAFIPAVGPAVIWLPAVVILFVQGNILQSVILIVYCVLVLGSIDAFLKPKLIGDKIKMSSFWILLGVIGGLQVFGLLGFFLGPLILALLSSFIQMYRELS